MTVSDPGSELLATGQFSVGLSGQGSLLVENQGTVTTGDNAVDATEGFDIAQNAGASATAAVTGTNSLLTNTGRFVVGDAGLGSLGVNSGGTVTTSANATIGNSASAAGSSANVTGGNFLVAGTLVDGKGASLNVTNSLVVGVAGVGELSVLDGASVTIGGDLDIGVGAGASGNVDIENTTGTTTINGGITLGAGGAWRC